jgi:hypothetical protein
MPNWKKVITSGSDAVLASTTTNELTITGVVNAGVDTDKFLVLDSSNNVDFRTGAEVLSDIGGGGGSSVWTTDTNGITYTTGNVGIGANSLTDSRLLVRVKDSAPSITFQSTSGEDRVHFLIGGDTTSARFDMFNQAEVQTFRLSAAGDSYLNGGNTGIGTTAPSQKIHVNGNARVTGAYYDSNNSPGTSGQILSSTATGTDWITASPILKAISIPNPVAADDVTLFYTPTAITISAVYSHIIGSTNVVYNLRFASSRNSISLTSVFTSNITLTSNAGQTNNSGFNDATIPAGNWVWLNTVSVSGTPSLFHLTVEYTQD